MVEPLTCGKTGTYAPGNLGDIIKHSWLIEVTRILLYGVRDKPFVYADVFAGCPEYPLASGDKGWTAWGSKIQTSLLARLQQDFELRGKYAGSTTLVRLVCKEASAPLEILAYDADGGRCEVLTGSGTVLLDLKSGYDILDDATLLHRADLLLLDPYNFLPRSNWEKHIGGLVSAAEDAPTLLFLYNKMRFHKNYDSFRTKLAELTRDKVTGCVGRLRGASAWYEMMLLYKKGIEWDSPVSKALESMTHQLTEATDVESKFEPVG